MYELHFHSLPQFKAVLSCLTSTQVRRLERSAPLSLVFDRKHTGVKSVEAFSDTIEQCYYDGLGKGGRLYEPLGLLYETRKACMRLLKPGAKSAKVKPAKRAAKKVPAKKRAAKKRAPRRR